MTVDFTVTHYYAGFTGSRDGTTGHRLFNWTLDSSTVEMPFYARGQRGFQTPAGYMGICDYAGWTIDPVETYDHIVHQGSRYELVFVKPQYKGDNFIRRDVALTLLSMYEETAASATWKASPNDPRSMMKAWIDLRDTPANITKNDGSTLASYAVIFAYPAHFHLEWEFRASSSPVQGLYVIDNPTNTMAMFDCDNSVIDYKEMVPVHIMTVDSTDCGAEQLYWKMDAELRRIGQEHPTGSWHQLDRTAKQDTFLGSMKLVDRVTYWEYTRGGLT